MPPDEICYVVQLLGTRQMIERHRRRRKAPAAVGARTTLEILVPPEVLRRVLTLLRTAERLCSLVVVAVVNLPARLAPNLVSALASMELGQRLSRSAAATELHRFLMIVASSDN
jgi:hypothetical protein